MSDAPETDIERWLIVSSYQSPESMIGLFVKQLNAKLADEYRTQKAEIERLRADNAQIRGALQAALNWNDGVRNDGEWVSMARRALEEKT